jgi:hypothetical protein
VSLGHKVMSVSAVALIVVSSCFARLAAVARARE